jgi:hypothetical protein
MGLAVVGRPGLGAVKTFNRKERKGFAESAKKT